MDKKDKFKLHHQQEQREDILRERQHAWSRQCMQSQLKRMSCGGQRIIESMSWAHKDNWRRKNVKK